MNNLDRPIGSLNALPLSAVILDRAGTIVAVNATWRDFGAANGLRLKQFGVGANYLDYCNTEDLDGRPLACGLRELFDGDREMIAFPYACHSPSQRRWFYMIGMPLAPHEREGIALFHVNLSTFVPILSEISSARDAGAWVDEDAFAGHVGAINSAAPGGFARVLSAQLAAMIDAPQTASADAAAPQHPAGIQTPAMEALSKRQLEVFRLLGQGKTNSEIARTLSRSPHTVKLHVSAILQRLEVRNRTQAALLAARIFGKKRDQPHRRSPD